MYRPKNPFALSDADKQRILGGLPCTNIEHCGGPPKCLAYHPPDADIPANKPSARKRRRTEAGMEYDKARAKTRIKKSQSISVMSCARGQTDSDVNTDAFGNVFEENRGQSDNGVDTDAFVNVLEENQETLVTQDITTETHELGTGFKEGVGSNLMSNFDVSTSEVESLIEDNSRSVDDTNSPVADIGVKEGHSEVVSGADSLEEEEERKEDDQTGMLVNLTNIDVREWIKDPKNVYIGRETELLEGSKWGNPYPMYGTNGREIVVKKFEEYFRNNKKLLKDIHELKGKNLGGWCPPKLCHGRNSGTGTQKGT